MAYATGTGSNQQDFLDAVRSFGLGLGWTINKFDTTNKLLYMSKGLCRICLEWFNVSVTVWNGATSSSVSEGRIIGSLVQTIGTTNDWYAFAGGATAPNTTGRTGGPTLMMSNMQGPYVGWFLFSNATGDYIYAVVQTSADTYTYLGFGNADKGGLTHSGAAFAFSDGGKTWYRDSSPASTVVTSPSLIYNKPGSGGNFFAASVDRFNTACFHIYTENALPAGFLNNVASASFFANLTNSRNSQTAMPLKTRGRAYDTPSIWPTSSALSAHLHDCVITMSAPGYTSFVPMLGIPLIFVNSVFSLACAVGSVPDLRVLNMTGMSPQQELALGSDTWKVFPQLRQADWSSSLVTEAPSSGQYAFAVKKIL